METWKIKTWESAINGKCIVAMVRGTKEDALRVARRERSKIDARQFCRKSWTSPATKEEIRAFCMYGNKIEELS